MRCYLLVYPLIWCLLASWCVSVAPCGMLCVVSSCIVLSPAIGCTCLLVLSVVYRSRSCMLLLLLVVGLIVLSVACRACWLLLSVVLSCLLAALVGRLVVPALVVLLPHCSQWPPPGPRGYRQAVRYPTIRRGGCFLRGGRGRPKPTPSPFLCARSKKMWFFSAKRVKTGRI